MFSGALCMHNLISIGGHDGESNGDDGDGDGDEVGIGDGSAMDG